MKITNLRVTPVRLPLEKEFHASTFVIRERATVIIEIETDDGPKAEVFIGDERDHQPAIVKAIEDDLAELILGKNPRRLGALGDDLHAFRSRRPGDPVLGAAVAALDVALWDLFGRIAELPVVQILGARRSSIDAIVTCGYSVGGETSEKLLLDRISRIQEAGYKGIKLKVGARDIATDIRLTNTIRREFGPDFDIICDANRKWSVAEARRFADGVRECALAWLEEPTSDAEGVSGMAEIRRHCGIPIAAGQSEITGSACLPLVQEQAVDVLNFDSSIGGGFTECVRVARLAELAGLGVAHHEEPMVSSHLLAAVRDGRYAEFFEPDRDPLSPLLAINFPTVRNGRIEISQAPGFGMQIDWDFASYLRRTAG